MPITPLVKDLVETTLEAFFERGDNLLGANHPYHLRGAGNIRPKLAARRGGDNGAAGLGQRMDTTEDIFGGGPQFHHFAALGFAIQFG